MNDASFVLNLLAILSTLSGQQESGCCSCCDFFHQLRTQLPFIEHLLCAGHRDKHFPAPSCSYLSVTLYGGCSVGITISQIRNQALLEEGEHLYWVVQGPQPFHPGEGGWVEPRTVGNCHPFWNLPLPTPSLQNFSPPWKNQNLSHTPRSPS